MTEELSQFIDGEYIKGQSGRFGDIFNPATGETTRQVPLASAGEVRRAIASAAQAVPAWSASTCRSRYQWRTIASAVGNALCLAPIPSTRMEGVRFYTKLKTITARWPSGIKEGAVFKFHAGSDTKGE